MKKLILALLACAPIFAQCPSGYVQVTGTLSNPDGSGFSGTLTPSLGYITPIARQNTVTITVTNGVMVASNNAGNICLAPGNYTVTNRVGTSKLSYPTYWAVPTSGPVTVQAIEGSTQVTPSLSVPLAFLTPNLSGTSPIVVNSTTGAISCPTCGAGGIIASTSNILKGDGAGNAIAVTGTGTNCVQVNGSSSACAPSGFVSSQNPGTDNLCAVGKDATLFLDGSLKTSTIGGSSAGATLNPSGTWTTTGGAGTGATGTYTSSANALSTVVITSGGSGYTSNPTFVLDSGTLGSNTVAFSGCANTANATSATAFSSSVTIPAGALSANTIPVNFTVGNFATATATTIVFTVKLGSTVIFTSSNLAPGAPLYQVNSFRCVISAGAAASTTTPVVMGCAVQALNSPTLRNTLPLAGAFTIPVNTTISQVLTVTITHSAATAGNAMWLYSISPY